MARATQCARCERPNVALRSDEVAQLAGERVEQPYRDIFTFAIYSGLRAGEIFGLEWSDVDFDSATAKIRHSWRGTPTKRGEIRTLHLFGPALEALRRQKVRSSKRAHVFAAADGQPHSHGHDAQLAKWLDSCGIKRRVRFHDLRHTCASHLASGTWARAWTIEEVAAHLGHSTSISSRRYAHLSAEGLARAAKETRPELAQTIELTHVTERVSKSDRSPLGSPLAASPRNTKTPDKAEAFIGATYPNKVAVDHPGRARRAVAPPA